MRKKRTFTLLEVIISLSLTAILLTVLIGSATRLFSMRALIESAKQEVLAKKLLQERLSSLLFSLAKHPTTETGLPKEEPQGPIDSSDGKRLTLWLDSLIDHNPAFCGKKKGALFVENETLVFELIGSNKEIRKEVLLEGVEYLSFQFYDPFEEPPHLIDNWKERTGELPSHLILTIKTTWMREETELAFFFPSADNFVVYHPPIHNKDEARR